MQNLDEIKDALLSYKFNIDFLESIYERYFNKVLPFYDNMYTPLGNDKYEYFYYNTGEIVNVKDIAKDYEILTTYSPLVLERAIYDDESDYLLFVKYTIDNPFEKVKKNGVLIEEIYVLNRIKFCCHMTKNGIFIIKPGSDMKKIMHERFNINSFYEIVPNYFGKIFFYKGSEPRILIYSNFDEFICRPEILRTESKTQLLLDEIQKEEPKLIGYKKSDPKKDVFKSHFCDVWYRNNTPSVYVFKKADIQLLKNGWLLIREFIEYFDRDDNFEAPILIENLRIYYKNGKFIRARKCIDGTFVIAKGVVPMHMKCPLDLTNIQEEVWKESKLQYFKDIIKDSSEINRFYFIFCLLKYPDLEQLYKIGFEKVIKEISKSAEIPDYNMDYALGKPIKGKKNIANKYGLNSYQANVIARYLNDDTKKHTSDWSIVRQLREIINDLSSLDNNTFDKLFKHVSAPYAYFNIHRILKNLTRLKGLQFAIEKVEELEKIDEDNYKKTKTYDRRGSIAITYSDIVQMRIELGDYVTDDVFKITDRDKLIETHDRMVKILNANRTKIQDEGVYKTYKKLKKYFYEDENFLIVAPKTGEEIAKEGNSLGHCVGSYISYVAKGSTNILFLRKKSAPDKPFFTIEMTNEKKIRQIHGFANSNITSNKEAQAFYLKWLKEMDIKNYTQNGIYAARD